MRDTVFCIQSSMPLSLGFQHHLDISYPIYVHLYFYDSFRYLLQLFRVVLHRYIHWRQTCQVLSTGKSNMYKSLCFRWTRLYSIHIGRISVKSYLNQSNHVVGKPNRTQFSQINPVPSSNFPSCKIL